MLVKPILAATLLSVAGLALSGCVDTYGVDSPYYVGHYYDNYDYGGLILPNGRGRLHNDWPGRGGPVGRY